MCVSLFMVLVYGKMYFSNKFSRKFVLFVNPVFIIKIIQHISTKDMIQKKIKLLRRPIIGIRNIFFFLSYSSQGFLNFIFLKFSFSSYRISLMSSWCNGTDSV